MDISDIDIYDDLDEFQEKEEKKSTELLELEAKYKESLETIELMKAEMKTLHKKQRIMEVNFQNLLDTAKTEIKRKNDQIVLLQREKDDICFRRKHVSTSMAAITTHKQLNDGDGSAANFSHHQKVNPFKQNATIAEERLKHINSLPIAGAAVTELPTELLATTTATNSKRQLSPIDSDESWKEEDNVGSRHKKPRYDEHRKHRRAASGSGKDEEATSASNCDSSHSRERSSKSYNDARSSRYKFNKNSRCSDTEDRYNDYQRERSRGRREREFEHEHHRSRQRRSKSREGRRREHHESHDRRHRNVSRSDLARAEHEKYSKKEAYVKPLSRSSSRKESSKDTLDSRNYSEESNKKSHNIKYEYRESKYERKEQTKAKTEVEKKWIHLERAEVNKKVILDDLDIKDNKNPFLENYKIPKIKHEDKQFDSKKFLEKSLSEDVKANYSSKRCTSLYNAKDASEVETLPNTAVDRAYSQYKNHTDISLVYDEMDAEFSPNNLSNCSSDTIIFELTKDTSIKNSDNNVPNVNFALNTPKKVALFDALFGKEPGDDKTNKSSKLLGNVLEILKNDTTKTVLSADNKSEEADKFLSPDLSKKDALDSCLLQSNKSAQLITGSSLQNKNVAKKITKNSAEEGNFKNNEIIEICDDTDIDSTDEEIQFFNIVAPPKNSDITNADTADLTKTTSDDVSKNITKVDKTKKPVIEIIEDIRLPTVLPIKQILKKHEETRAQKQQQVIANKNTDNLSLLLEDGELQSEENIEYSPNITAFNTDDELDISDQTEIIFDETNMSLEVVSDDQLSDLEDIKESKVNSLTVDNIASSNSDVEQSNKQENVLKNVNKSSLSATEQEQCLHKSAVELNNVESNVIHSKLESDIITTKQAQSQDGADAIVYIDIDENSTEKEQESEKQELFDETEKLHNKQDIALSTKETTNVAIDSNINTFDMEVEEDKQNNFIEKIVSVADMSTDIKATFNKEDVNTKNNDTNVKLFTESAEQENSIEEADQNVIISINTLLIKDIFPNNQAACIQSADTDQFKEKLIDDKNFVTNDHLEKADENMKQITLNEVVVKADVVPSKREDNIADNKDTFLNNTPHVTPSIRNEKEEHTLINTITIEELEEEESIDKLENIDEEERAKTQDVEDIENIKGNKENIKMTQEKNDIATKVSKNSAIKNVNFDNSEKNVVEANNDMCCENLEKLREEESIVNCTDIAIDNIENHEVAQIMPEEEVICKNNAIEDKLDHNKEKHTLENDKENTADIEIDAEMRKLEDVLEVGLIEIGADIKELEVDLEVNENNAKKDDDIIRESIVTKDIDKMQEIVQPEIFASCSNDIDVKASTHNENVPASSKNIIPRYYKTASTKEVNNDLQKSMQDNTRHIIHGDWETKAIKEKKAYENFKKSVASDDRRGTSKRDSKEDSEDVAANCSKIAIDILNETSNTKIVTNAEMSKVEDVPSVEDQEKLRLQEVNVPPNKQPYESKLKVKSEDDKMGQQSVDECALDNSDVIQHSAHDMYNEESKIKTASYKKQMNTGNGEEKVENKSNEHEIKNTVSNEALIAKVKPEKGAISALNHIETHELDHNNKIKELAIKQLRELSAIVVPDEKNDISSEDKKNFSPKVLSKQEKEESAKEKQPFKKSPVKTKNYFKILVAPKVESHKRKLPDGYKIPKVKQPKLDDITVDPNCTEKTKNLAKPIAAKFKDHKENLKTKAREDKKARKDSSSTAKNSTKISSNKTASCSMKTVSKPIFGEDTINIPINNNTSHSSMESRELLQTHKLEICDPRNPLYSTMTHTKVGKITQKVNEKLLESQLNSVHSDIQATQIPTTNINDNTPHSELKSTTNKVNSQVSPNTQSLASTAAYITTAKQIKSKHFRRILDSSSGDEGSDEQNLSSAQCTVTIADHLSTAAANIITSNRELKRKKTKRRVVRVTTIGEALKIPQHEIPAQSVPVHALPTPIRAPPTPDHAIFHTEPESSYSYAESALPQFNNLQDKQYTDIDSRLQSMFQSPPYVADHQNALAVNSENLLSPLYREASISPPAEQNSLSDSGKNASNLETKRLSVGTSEYRVEKVSENVVNVFITRKRHKKKNTILSTNNTAKPELLTSVDAEGIA